MIAFDKVDWKTTVYCWVCEALQALLQVKKEKHCKVCGVQIAHGPRATIIAPPGRTLLAFDADALHYRIAACLSQDSFINESLSKYDETGDPIWKPHIRNCSALFGISPEEAVQLMNAESNKYVFAKNFIYMLLNGGRAPALANSAAMTGLKLTVQEVDKLVKNWLAKATGFDRWRKGLVEQACRTGQIVLADGRRRRFYDLRMKDGSWMMNEKSEKEVYNFPLIGTEVSYVNPRLELVYQETVGTSWKLVYHGHDGFMLEGDEGAEGYFAGVVSRLLSHSTEISPGKILKVPWAAKAGRNWAVMGKV